MYRKIFECAECNSFKTKDSFKVDLEMKIRSATPRCLQCQLPKCFGCGRKSQVPVQVGDKMVGADGKRECGAWYCLQQTCQAQKPEDRQCTTCGERKIRQSDFNCGTRLDWHYSDRCKSCEFPSCGHCGRAYAGLRAIQRKCASIVEGRWYCSDKPCKVQALKK